MAWWQRLRHWLKEQALSEAEKAVLTAVARGETLKSHRYLDGTKQYKLWPTEPDRDPTPVPYNLVQQLLDKKLLTTNQKFPSATFLLTTAGKELVSRWDEAVQGVADVVNFDG